MIIDENKLNLAKDLIFNSSDIETILAVSKLKKIKKYKEEISNNKLNIKELDNFIYECIIKYKEIEDIIKENTDNKIYLYKKEYYIKKLENIELGIYIHILLIKNKIDGFYNIIGSF